MTVTFGYCEFETIEGVLRCMRLMNGMYLYGKSLEVKFSEKTQLFIRDFYDMKKKELIAEGRPRLRSQGSRQRPHRKRRWRGTDEESDSRGRASHKADASADRDCRFS